MFHTTLCSCFRTYKFQRVYALGTCILKTKRFSYFIFDYNDNRFFPLSAHFKIHAVTIFQLCESQNSRISRLIEFTIKVSTSFWVDPCTLCRFLTLNQIGNYAQSLKGCNSWKVSNCFDWPLSNLIIVGGVIAHDLNKRVYGVNDYMCDHDLPRSENQLINNVFQWTTI